MLQNICIAASQAFKRKLYYH